jgi:phosphoribosylamine---glycine ligase
MQQISLESPWCLLDNGFFGINQMTKIENYRKILIVGSGGREHAIGWNLFSNPGNCLFFAPGNGGTDTLGTNINIEPDQQDRLISFAKKEKINLTVIGPEVPLSDGIVDAFQTENLAAFGPSKLAVQLESSKVWASEFMKRHSIPQPESNVFRDVPSALDYVRLRHPENIVIKADGLCAGKGVILPHSQEEALSTVQRMLSGVGFGEAGKTIVIQDRLVGREVSVMAFTDGDHVVLMLPAEDHKQINDHDQGPNTGGMGAVAPVSFLTPSLLERIHQEILLPTVAGMKKEGRTYKGVLFAGLMITKAGPKVMEFNCRFGDPETQSLMMLLKSDLANIFISCIQGTLKKSQVKYSNKFAVCVVLTSSGYPNRYEKGIPIFGLEKNYGPDINIFHAGTIFDGGQMVSNGGRVLGVTAVGKTLELALQKAYAVIGENGVYFDGMHYRRDIGRRSYGK